MTENPVQIALPTSWIGATALHYYRKRKPPFQMERGVLLCDVFLVLRLDGARFGNIDFERVIGQGIGIEHADRLICIGLCGHGHKSEAFRHASPLVFDELHRRDRSGLCEQGIDFILSGRLGQVSYINSNIHFMTAFSGRAGNKNDRNPISGSAAKGTTEIQLFITPSV